MININEILSKCKKQFDYVDEICEINSLKILESFRKNRVSESHFAPSTGYGYGNSGREIINKVFAKSFGAESALVSSSFVSGTHAISVALFALLRPNQRVLFITGKPYDTIDSILNGSNCCSLKDFEIKHEICDYKKDNLLFYLKKSPEVVYIQKSRGYSFRDSLSILKIKNLIEKIKFLSPESVVLVDNCYGEFVEQFEPTDVGADLIVGSLIKNPGAGISPSGGYIAGKRELVSLCEQRLLASGLKDMGASSNNREILMGLFYSPLAVRESLKSGIFASALFEYAGFEVSPRYDDKRYDIVTCIKLENEKNLLKFCESVQKYSPIDSFVVPEPWNMPGYDHKVVMAAGGFVSGSSIELSADAPLKEPFAVWFQGGTNFYLAKKALISSFNEILMPND